MQRVVVDANVLVSLLTGRDPKQSEAARALLEQAENGDVVAVVPQFVIFEVVYVLHSLYMVTGERLGSLIRDVVTFPGIHVIDRCPWPRIFKIWPSSLADLADAAIVALATTDRYDAVATFDHKLSKRLDRFGLTAYF